MEQLLAGDEKLEKVSLSKLLKRHAESVDALTIRDLATSLGRDELAQAANRLVDARSLNWTQLRALTPYLIYSKSHDLYEQAIGLFDANVSFGDTFGSKRFITGGEGDGSLNTYRKLSVNDYECFEKIYLSESTAWQRASYFYDVVVPQLDLDFPTPQILSVTHGDRLTRVCFEYVSFKKCIADCVAKAERILQQLSLVAGQSEEFQFIDSPRYRLARHRLLKRSDISLSADDVTVIKDWEGRMLTYPTVFSHGDLNFNNLSQKGVAVDWDESGFFPEGFDLAVLISDFVNPLSLEQALDALEKLRPGFSRKPSFASFVFFLVAFTALKGAAATTYSVLIHDGLTFLRNDFMSTAK